MKVAPTLVHPHHLCRKSAGIDLVLSLKDAWIGLRSHTQGWPQGAQNDQVHPPRGLEPKFTYSGRHQWHMAFPTFGPPRERC